MVLEVKGENNIVKFVITTYLLQAFDWLWLDIFNHYWQNSNSLCLKVKNS